MPQPDPDGAQLLTSAEVGELLGVAVEHAGGTLLTWALDQPCEDTRSRSSSVEMSTRIA